MSLVLGVLGIPKVEVELLRIILRLSSNLRSLWTVSESQPWDVLLVEGSHPLQHRHATGAAVVIVPVVARTDVHPAESALRRTLARPIFAEELVDLLNEITPAVQQSRSASSGSTGRPSGRHREHDMGRLVRWPAQATLTQNPAYVRLASALSKSAQSAHGLSALSGLAVTECAGFLRLLDEEGALAWSSPSASAAAASASAPARASLLSRIRRRLGLGR